MSKQEGIGNFVINEDEIAGTTFDIFSLPEKESNTLWGKEVEIRLLTVLERFVIKFFFFFFNNK